jgi:hypothetical protein
MPISKAVVKKRAAALKAKLAKAAAIHEQMRLDALQHAQDVADLAAEAESDEGAGPEFAPPETPIIIADSESRPYLVMDIPLPSPKRTMWQRFLDTF